MFGGVRLGPVRLGKVRCGKVWVAETLLQLTFEGSLG